MRSHERLSFAALLAIQVRTIGLAFRREAALAVAALACVCILTTVTSLRFDDRLDLIPEMMLIALPVALLLPWAIWKGDPAFGRAPLWTLPVRRQKAAAAKIVAGALWVMLAALTAFLFLVLTSLATGGRLGIDEVLLVGPASAGLDKAAHVAWSTPLWAWLVPFGATLLAYLLGSAILLGFRRPLRWIGGALVCAILIGVLGVNFGEESRIAQGLVHFLQTIVAGKVGLDFALTGGTATLAQEIDLPGPGSVNLWRALPDAGRWAAALAVWFAGALLALALALRRHWER
jgi:hypothetical protein